MSPVKGKRGRPKSARTLERERIEDMMKNIPANMRMTASEKKTVTAQLVKLDVLKKSILKAHKSPPMPANTVFEIESACPEFMTEEEIEETVKRYQRVEEHIKDGQQRGGEKIATKAADRARRVLEKNNDLVRLVRAGKNLTAHSAAKTIYDEWEHRANGQAGGRGDGSLRPSKRQIRRWF
jgi:hypothetical protein